jgi:mono/diheme cytochrome c family protein
VLSAFDTKSRPGRKASPSALGVASGAALMLALVSPLACERAAKTPLQDGAGHFARYCAGCHGLDGRGTANASFKVPPRDLTNPEFQDGMNDATLRQAIVTGKDPMPAFGPILAPEQIDHIVLFVRTLRQKE